MTYCTGTKVFTATCIAFLLRLSATVAVEGPACSSDMAESKICNETADTDRSRELDDPEPQPELMMLRSRRSIRAVPGLFHEPTCLAVTSACATHATTLFDVWAR